MAEAGNQEAGQRAGSAASAPRVWVLLDDRPGNSTQSLGLAEALGWPFETVELLFGWRSRLHNRWLGASVRGLRSGSRAKLVAPWPDLVIAAGRRTAPVGLWIKRASGGKTRLVQLGRKGADAADLFDLSVTPRYTRQLAHERRFETTGPLHRIEKRKLAAEASAWTSELVDEPERSRLVLLVGGTSGQYRMNARTAQRLGEAVARMALDAGAALYVSISRRTPAAAADALERALGPTRYFYRWSPSDQRNPYLAYLALGQAFVITGDSESMLVEACSMAKPVWIYPLPVRWSFRWLRFNREWVVRRAAAHRRRREQGRGSAVGLGALCARLVERGYVRPARNLDRMHFDLIERGLALRFGTEAPKAGTFSMDDERQKVAEAVRELMEPG